MDVSEFIAALQDTQTSTDRAMRAKALSVALDAFPRVQTMLRAQRQAEFSALHDEDGLSWTEIGALVGRHPQRAAQIAKGVTGGAKKRPEKP